LRRLLRRLAQGDPSAGKDLARFPARVAAMVLATSSIGYFLGALQVGHFAYLPPLEFAKITLQGPVLGGLFGVAAYLLAEEAIEGVPVPSSTPPAGSEVIHSLYGKVFGITVVLTLGLSVQLFLYGLGQAQRQREEVRAHAMEQVLEGLTIRSNLEQSLAQFGTHTYGFIVRRSNNFVVGGKGAGTVLFGDGRRDFGIIQQSEHGWFASRDGEHKVVAFTHRPGVLPDGDGAVFVAVSPIQDYGAELLSASRTTAAVAIGVLLIGLGLAGMLAHSIVRPIERLRAAASQMAQGDRQVETVAIARGDEVAALARAFDQMAERVRTDEASLRTAYEQLQQTQAQLVQHERLSAIGRVVSAVAHELNNPLSAVLHLSEELQAESSPTSPDREALETITEQARRCRTIVRDLLSFARGRRKPAEPTEAETVLGSAQAAAEPAMHQARVRMEIAVAGSLPVLAVDRAGIEQVLTNLFVNGAQAAGPGGVVRVEAAAEAGGWHFAVEDSGPGIPATVLPRIFEPFFTTKPEGQGTGLGLAVSLGIVERHRGTVRVEPGGNGRGARFVVRILPAAPAAEPASGQAVESDGGNGAAARRQRALIVDDERSIRLALTRYLQRQGREVDQAEDGEVALRMLEESPASGYGLMISDLRMPRRSGLEVHDWLAQHRPDLFVRLIIATGDVASPPVRSFIARTPRPVIEKPFELSALAELVRTTMKGER
jgi:signal transduction histidine kinase